MTPSTSWEKLAAAAFAALSLVFISSADARERLNPSEGVSESASPKQCAVTGDAPAINIRAAPGGNILGQIPVGTPVSVSYVQRPWVFVSTQRGTGWIWGQHVDPACIPTHYYIAPCGPDCEPAPPLPYHLPVGFAGATLAGVLRPS